MLWLLLLPLPVLLLPLLWSALVSYIVGSCSSGSCSLLPVPASLNLGNCLDRSWIQFVSLAYRLHFVPNVICMHLLTFVDTMT